MRKHDARKWLHATLDLLPVILIPVFMIYSHRHTIDSYSVQYAQNEVVDFNQRVLGFNTGDYEINDIDVNVSTTNFYILNGTSGSVADDMTISSVNCIANHKYFLTGAFFQLYDDSFSWVANISDPINWYLSSDVLYTPSINGVFNVKVRIGSDLTFNYSVFYPQVFDLTQMFGSGNEPTIEQFNQWYPNDYYEYTLSHKELLKGVSTVTYNDTEITSQLTYSLYNTVNNYFNFGNVFNLGGVYDWFTLNIFNGNVPLVVPIIWNIAVYEFIMDLIFLLYALFMFFIDFCTNLIDRFHTKCSGGK